MMSKIYLIKTGYDCCGDDDCTIGIFTDLDIMLPVILKTADQLWEYESFPYLECKKNMPIDSETCDKNCKNCQWYNSYDSYIKSLQREKQRLLYPNQNVYVETWEENVPINNWCEENDNGQIYKKYELRKFNKKDKNPLIDELYGYEIYHFVLPIELEDLPILKNNDNNHVFNYLDEKAFIQN